jgi:uncharacterized repeat protein (TIGR03843 family)
MTTPPETVLTALSQGEFALKGEFMWGSNYTYLVTVAYNETETKAVYKPTRGEQPLWDFPAATLARREAAAYVVSEALGWRLVPPTIYRKDGPLGAGSLQYYIEHVPEYHYFNFTDADRQRLRPVALFDHLINNADRKGSHILFDADGHLWLIDHGICFHVEEKLRTVVWDFAGEALPGGLCPAVEQLRCDLSLEANPPANLLRQLQPLLSRAEINALRRRAERLLDAGRFPNPHPNRRPFPWPPV